MKLQPHVSCSAATQQRTTRSPFVDRLLYNSDGVESTGMALMVPEYGFATRAAEAMACDWFYGRETGHGTKTHGQRGVRGTWAWAGLRATLSVATAARTSKQASPHPNKRSLQCPKACATKVAPAPVQ